MAIHFKLFQGEEPKPFIWRGGQPTALLVQGFPGTPAELRPLSEPLYQAGWTVEGLLLPGFGADILFWTGLGFILGAMPFSLWLGYLFLHTDIRQYGDGNPGATNAWKAGGWRLGVPALLLDYLKGVIPVGLAHFVAALWGWELVIVALASVLGHAFSPFLGFKGGGKALAVTFGIWTGLTLIEGPFVLGLFFAVFLLIQTSDGWAVLLGLLAFGIYLLLQHSDRFILAIWLGNTLLLAWKYRAEFRTRLQLRGWLDRLLRQNSD